MPWRISRRIAGGGIYNVGADGERPNIEIAREALRLTGKPEFLLERVTDRLGHDRRYAVDETKLRTNLGWKPKIEFTEGLKHSIRWYKENESWRRRILSGEYRVDRRTAKAVEEKARWPD